LVILRKKKNVVEVGFSGKMNYVRFPCKLLYEDPRLEEKISRTKKRTIRKRGRTCTKKTTLITRLGFG
jgi:hypothetical protein